MLERTPHLPARPKPEQIHAGTAGWPSVMVLDYTEHQHHSAQWHRLCATGFDCTFLNHAYWKTYDPNQENWQTWHDGID